MSLIDMHCDTLLKLADPCAKEDLYKNPYRVSIPSMKKAGVFAQFFACFVRISRMEGNTPEERCDAGYRRVCELVDYMRKQERIYRQDMRVAVSAENLADHKRRGVISAVLTVEEGGILNGDMERLDALNNLGIRLITLLWNEENCIGHPNSRDAGKMEMGLKPFGIQTVERMNELGIIIDVSHASDGTFWDVVRYSKKPVVASHSNCRALCAHPRNLSDDMIHALAERGGAAGLNFYGRFLGGADESRIDAMVQHIKYMINVGGSDFPAIGTDFDGFEEMDVLEIPDISQMDLLRNALQKAGITPKQIDKIWSENALRVVEENW